MPPTRSGVHAMPSKPGAGRSALASIARATRTSSAAEPDGRSSPATRGSATGAATPSSRSAASAWRPDGSARRATSSSSGRCRLRGHAAEPLSRSRRDARVQRGRRVALVRDRDTRAPRDDDALTGGRADAPQRRRGDPRRLRAGHALRHPARRRRAPRRRHTRGPAHLDGRQGGRLGDDAADRQAGRGPGPVAERPRGGERVLGALGRGSSPRARGLPLALLAHRRGLPQRRRRPGRRDLPPEPDLRGRRSSVAPPRRPAGTAGRRRGRGATLDALRAALTRSGRAGLHRAVRRRGPRARRGVSPGDRLALASRPFVEAWVRVRGGTVAAKAEARVRFFTPLLAHLQTAGLGHLSEIADGDPPHTPRGCPFQAWSVGEALRLDLAVLAR